MPAFVFVSKAGWSIDGYALFRHCVLDVEALTFHVYVYFFKEINQPRPQSELLVKKSIGRSSSVTPLKPYMFNFV